MSERTGGIEVAKTRRKKKKKGVRQPWGQGDGGGTGHWEPGGVRDWTVYWVFLAKYIYCQILNY